MSRNLFITGTGTDVGKTYVTGLIIKKLNEYGKKAGYYKCAMSGNISDNEGNIIAGDAMFVKSISGINQPIENMCPYVYKNAVSPHLAARIENNEIDIKNIIDGFYKLSNEYDYITIEGSGGIVCPLRFDEEKIQLIDIIKNFNFNCIIVADAGLGTINSVVLTAEFMKAHNIEISGIIFNNYEPNNIMHNDNLHMCEELTGLKVIACIKHNDTDINISFRTLDSFYK